MRTRVRLRPSLVAAVVAAALLMTGCVPESSPSPTAPPPPPSPTTTPSPSPSSSAPEDGEDRADGDDDAEPVTIACDELVTPETMYDFNPNFALLADWTPDAGTAAASAVASDGVACRWQNLSSGIVIDVSAARPGESAISDLAGEAAAAGTSFDGYAARGYFSTAGDVGTATAFPGDAWVVVTSRAFLEPGEATPLVDAAIAALR